MFKGVSTKQFDNFFRCEDDCRKYLFDLKWKRGYSCRRCSHGEYWKGRTRFHTRCKKCDYNESVSANTFFEGIKLPLLKAFKMAFIISAKKGMSSVDLAIEFGINQKSAWLFATKVRKAIPFYDSSKVRSKVRRIIDGIILSHRRENCNGLQKVEVSLCQEAEAGVKKPQVYVAGSEPDIKDDDFLQCDLVHGSYEGLEPDIRIWNFKAWLIGTHHHCSLKYSMSYLKEFFFRQNNSSRKDLACHRLLSFMAAVKPARFI